MVACEKAFCLGDMPARSFSWLSCARSFGRSLARSFVQLARLFSLAACLRALSRSSLLRSLAWLVCAFSLAARKRKWKACTHANHLHVLKSTQQATVIETLFELVSSTSWGPTPHPCICHFNRKATPFVYLPLANGRSLVCHIPKA